MTSPPTAVQPLGCTHLKLRRLVRDVARWYDDDLRDLGLKGTQYMLLSHVLRMGPERPGVLARAMGVDASTLTRNLQPMVEAGWVALVAGSDARSRLVRITPAGRALRERAQARWRRSQQRVNDTLGAEAVIALHALLDACTERVERAQGLRPDDPDRGARAR